jgi:hypothetical protein
MVKTHFKALDLNVQLGMFQRFTDHGYVEDPRAFTKTKGGRVGGLAWATPDNSLFYSPVPNLVRAFAHAHICYTKDDEFRNPYRQMYDLLLRCHEETHALQALGKLTALEGALKIEQNVIIDLTSMRDIELSANAGAVYALLKHYGWQNQFELVDFILARPELIKATGLYLESGGNIQGLPPFWEKKIRDTYCKESRNKET